jgi:proton-translocating NADH-quinone oxidoreductase chain M
MLSYIFGVLFFGLLFLLSLKDTETKLLKSFSLFLSGTVFLYSIKLLCNFNLNNYYFQDIVRYSFNFELFNLQLVFGLDGISLFFFILSAFLIFLCILFVFHDKSLRFLIINLFLIEILLLAVFSVLDLLFFYIFFEAILIPMFLIVGIWGSRDRKIWAVYMLFFYTICGSLLLLLGILYIYNITGTFNIEYLLNYNFSDKEQYFLWLAFFLSFASKIPVFPLHIWLPEAHVEAPTVGSVLLAGILLKLGVYGFVRFSLPLFPLGSLFFSPFVYSLCVVGVIYTSFAAIRQIDLKRIIAYSSVAHMNLIVIGLFSFNFVGVEGAILQSVSHGFVSSALFFLIGMVYVRYHTRTLYYYGGITQIMPLFSTFFLIFTMANIALPGTSSFVGEFLILLGSFKANFKVTLLVATSVVLCGSYSLWVFNRISFGNLKHHYMLSYSDLQLREFCILLPLVFFTLLLGVFPFFFLKYIHSSVIYILLSTFI